MTLEQKYNKVVQQNKQLQGELVLARKMIEIMSCRECKFCSQADMNITCLDCTIAQAKQALEELNK